MNLFYDTQNTASFLICQAPAENVQTNFYLLLKLSFSFK